MKKLLKIIITIFFLALLLAGVFFGRKYLVKLIGDGQPPSPKDSAESPSANTGGSRESKASDKKEEGAARKSIRVEDIDFSRISAQEIAVTWPDQTNPYVSRYIVKKRGIGEAKWRVIGARNSDGDVLGREFTFQDTLDDLMPQQYEYRVDVKVTDKERYEAAEGMPVLASNILLCIDPGHYEGQNQVSADGIPYVEGDFTLELAKNLKKILRSSYGVTAYLTRESGTISMGGYGNDQLDQGYISLRGEYARGSNLFLSLHTNANLEDANGYATYSQPIEITKPIIIMNTVACGSASALAVANGVGKRLAEANYQMGIAVAGKFRPADNRDGIIQWTDTFNDGLGNPGTVCCRTGEGGDYYGVLKGAANVGVPGMIIEHGFHTVLEMRRQAAQGDLKAQWAKADADGIAEGLGLSGVMED